MGCWGGAEEDTRAGFVSESAAVNGEDAKTDGGEKNKKKKGKKSIKICIDMFSPFLPADSPETLSPQWFHFPLRARQTLSVPPLPWACFEGSTGLKSNFNNPIVPESRFRSMVAIQIRASNERR